MANSSQGEQEINSKRVNIWGILLGVVTVLGVLAAWLAIPGMPKLFHFDKPDAPAAASPPNRTGPPSTSAPTSQPQRASSAPSAAHSAPHKTQPSRGVHPGAVTQISTGNKSPNINGVTGDVNLNYGNSQQVSQPEAKQ